MACVDDRVVEHSWQLQGELYSRGWQGRREPGQEEEEQGEEGEGEEGEHREDRWEPSSLGELHLGEEASLEKTQSA